MNGKSTFSGVIKYCMTSRLDQDNYQNKIKLSDQINRLFDATPEGQLILQNIVSLRYDSASHKADNLAAKNIKNVLAKIGNTSDQKVLFDTFKRFHIDNQNIPLDQQKQYLQNFLQAKLAETQNRIDLANGLKAQYDEQHVKLAKGRSAFNKDTKAKYIAWKNRNSAGDQEKINNLKAQKKNFKRKSSDFASLSDSIKTIKDGEYATLSSNLAGDASLSQDIKSNYLLRLDRDRIKLRSLRFAKSNRIVAMYAKNMFDEIALTTSAAYINAIVAKAGNPKSDGAVEDIKFGAVRGTSFPKSPLSSIYIPLLASVADGEYIDTDPALSSLKTIVTTYFTAKYNNPNIKINVNPDLYESMACFLNRFIDFVCTLISKELSERSMKTIKDCIIYDCIRPFYLLQGQEVPLLPPPKPKDRAAVKAQ